MTDSQLEMVWNAISHRRKIAEHNLQRLEQDSKAYAYAEAERKVCMNLQDAVLDIKFGRNLHQYKTREEA